MSLVHLSRVFCRVEPTFNALASLDKIQSQVFVPVRHSRYSARYVEPTFRPSDFDEDIDAKDPRRFSPIKAPNNDQTSSLAYDSEIAMFIRKITREGNKQRARDIVDNTLEVVKFIQLKKYHSATDEAKALIEVDAKKIFHQALENCKPMLRLQKAIRGGNVYQVPIPINPVHQRHLAIKWLIESAKDKNRDVRIWNTLARELIDASKNEGRSIGKKQELHKICEANRAYAHYRW